MIPTPMKNLILVTFLFIGFVMCDNPSPRSAAADHGNTRVYIYYFHGTNRCGTCMAIEENTIKALEIGFPKEYKEGVIKFLSVNMDESANAALVEKCEASTMSLYMVRIDNDGKEKKTDFTEFAVNNARIDPEAYIAGLKTRISEQLK
jgi:hypothetical protein